MSRRRDRRRDRQAARQARIEARQAGRSERAAGRQAVRQTAYEMGVNPNSFISDIAESAAGVAGQALGAKNDLAMAQLNADREAQGLPPLGGEKKGGTSLEFSMENKGMWGAIAAVVLLVVYFVTKKGGRKR